jgi:F420H(2)-dependent quinone reductase
VAKAYRMNAFARFGNTMAAAMIKLGIAPAGMHLLTVRGRKSGLPRTTPVSLIEHQGPPLAGGPVRRSRLGPQRARGR